MSVRNWLNRLFAKKSPSAKKPRIRLLLEALEDRTVPTGQLLWTGSGSWSNATNWTDLLTLAHRTPTSSDQLLFGDGGAGANTDSTMDFSSLSVDSVVMDSSYTHTITITSGHTLTTTNQFELYGTLSISGGTVIAGTDIDVYGTVSATSPSATSTLTGSGSFFLTPTGGSAGTISVVGTPTPVLDISSSGFTDSGTITVGTSTSLGKLTISGPFTQSAGTL